MLRIHLRRVLRAGLLVMALSGNALGQSKNERAAREHDAAAAARLRAGDAHGVVTELSLANELARTPARMRELARAQRLAGDPLAAHRTYRLLLGGLAGKLTAQERNDAEAAAAEVEATLGSVTLEVSESDARVSVDDQEIGTTPLRAPLQLKAGSHSLRLTKPGFGEHQQQWHVPSGPSSLNVVLVPSVTTGTLSVFASTPRAMTLLLNGREIGPLPWNGDLAPGSYLVAAQGAAWQAPPRSVTIDTGRTTAVQLVPLPVSAQLRVELGASDAVISVDGKLVGAGTWRGQLEPGPHQLDVKREGFQPYVQSFTLEPGERLLIDRVDFKAASADRGTRKQPAKPLADDPARYRGVLANLSLIGLFGAGTSDEIGSDCSATETGGSCDSHSPLGGGLALRVGYSLGWVAIEAIGLAALDVFNSSAHYGFDTVGDSGHYGVARDERYTNFRYGYGGGLGARLLTRHPDFRLSTGLGAAVVNRTMRYVRVTTAREPTPVVGLRDVSEYDPQPVSYVAPALLGDVGVMLGSTPGVKLHAGILVMVEFSPSHVEAPGRRTTLGYGQDGSRVAYGTPELDMARGTQFLVGPFLAAQFGR